MPASSPTFPQVSSEDIGDGLIDRDVISSILYLGQYSDMEFMGQVAILP